MDKEAKEHINTSDFVRNQMSLLRTRQVMSSCENEGV